MGGGGEREGAGRGVGGTEVDGWGGERGGGGVGGGGGGGEGGRKGESMGGRRGGVGGREGGGYTKRDGKTIAIQQTKGDRRQGLLTEDIRGAAQGPKVGGRRRQRKEAVETFGKKITGHKKVSKKLKKQVTRKRFSGRA